MRHALALALVLSLLAGPAPAQPSFMSILPPGQDGFVPSIGMASPHLNDQVDMYDALIRAVPGISSTDLLAYFKDATIAPPAVPESTVSPRPGVVIDRDAFGVPHVTGATRADVFFGAGYATARDRLFFADILRHMGRGRLSEFIGGVLGLGATLGFDRTYYRVAGHSEAELEAIVTGGVMRDPVFGPLVFADSEAFRNGMNAYIAEARGDPSKMPIEYTLFGIPLEDWRLSDSAASGIAFCTVIGFCNGGGGEHENVQLLQALVARHGEKDGTKLYGDLRAGEDKAAPLTTRKKFPYMLRKRIDPAAVAMFDEGSFQDMDPITTAAAATSARAGRLPASAADAFVFPRGMSNWLAIRGSATDTGRPIMVGGPQTGYFAPQPLIEIALEGGGVNARGTTPAGVPYVVIGHTPDYAWTATAGGSDLVDVYVERLCTPVGADLNSGTMFNGTCVPMEQRVDTWMAGTTQVTATVTRTIHGPVIGSATVDGEPVLLARKRSTFGLEVDSGAAYIQLNDNLAQTPEQFRTIMAANNATLNWIYVNRTDIAYFHAGKYPRRPRGVDPDFPTWGTGEWEWDGFLDALEQPFDVDADQGFMTSWNNKPARKWRAADSSHGYTALYRSLLLDARLRPLVERGGVTLAEAVEAMALAATTDLRGQEILPDALALLRRRGSDDLAPYLDLLQGWADRGAQRLDHDGDGRYEDEAAIALMDAWWEPLIRSMFDPQLEDLYGFVRVGFHDSPANGLGSAFQGGYYGTVLKALRKASGKRIKRRYKVLRCAGSRRRRDCAPVVEASLHEAIDDLTARFGSDDPADWSFDPATDEIEFSVGGLAIQGPIPWQNRPTFQQAVQLRD